MKEGRAIHLGERSDEEVDRGKTVLAPSCERALRA
jgi:hypothetical protein